MAKSEVRRLEPGEGDSRSYRADWAHDRATYRITVRGCLDASWSEWFDGLAVTADCDRGQTTLAGPVADQAALHGLLNKVRNLGLTLLCVNRVDPREAGAAGTRTQNLDPGDHQTH